MAHNVPPEILAKMKADLEKMHAENTAKLAALPGWAEIKAAQAAQAALRADPKATPKAKWDARQLVVNKMRGFRKNLGV